MYICVLIGASRLGNDDQALITAIYVRTSSCDSVNAADSCDL